MDEHPESSVRDLLQQVMGQSIRQGLSANQRAALAWNECNGDRERAHTRGVVLVDSKKGIGDPRMIVYVDSNVLLADFRTNVELYLGRLAMWGMQVSSLEFRLSRDAGKPATSSVRQSSRGTAGRNAGNLAAADPLPPLTAAQEREIDELTAPLPEENRAAAARAMAAFYRRDNLV
ncbi:MAG: hypothetical protein U0L51_06880 [Olegusella sp.]|nr:hypothetical protein [Olegusella sp.]